MRTELDGSTNGEKSMCNIKYLFFPQIATVAINFFPTPMPYFLAEDLLMYYQRGLLMRNGSPAESQCKNTADPQSCLNCLPIKTVDGRR